LSRRRRSREFALQVLYQLDITPRDPEAALARIREHFSRAAERDEFAERIVMGVLNNREETDRLIERYSEHWRLGRMNMIDRNILRMACFELLHCDEIPPKVTMNEAIDLGKRYGTEGSGSFINGILDRIQNEVVRKPVQPKSHK
jgi:N utilization substance protein B